MTDLVVAGSAPTLGRVELLRTELPGRPIQAETAPGSPPFERGILGAAVSPKTIDGTEHTVVQLLFDDDHPTFDPSLLDCPLVAELRTPAGDVVTRELFDHDRFRRQLQEERATGGKELRGVLVLTGGELPPPYIRLAFLTVPVAETAGCELVVIRSERDALAAAIHAGHADGSLTDREHRGLLTTVEQRHPAGS